MAPHGRKPVDNSLPIEAISRVDGSIWKIELLRQMSATTWFIRWSIDGVDDRSVFDQEMSIDDMRPESMGCHQSACVEGRLREGVRVVAFISLPREHRSDPAVTGKVSRFDLQEGPSHMCSITSLELAK